MKHIFIMNPTSGDGKALKTISIIEEYFQSKDDFEIIITKEEGHATLVASQYYPEDNVCLYAVGGDGTAYEVLNGINKGVTMAIIPAGSGNDFYRVIGNYKEALTTLIPKVIEGKVISIDYGIANEHRFLNCCCMGIDADVVDHANRISKKFPLPRSFVYGISVLYKILAPRKMNITITTDNQVIKNESILFTAMNGRYYGGGFTPTPKAKLTDGLLNIVYVDFLSLIKIIPSLPKYFSGKHDGIKAIHNMELKKFKLESEKELLYCCDGEIYQSNKIDFEVIELGLQLKIPQESEIE